MHFNSKFANHTHCNIIAKINQNIYLIQCQFYFIFERAAVTLFYQRKNKIVTFSVHALKAFTLEILLDVILTVDGKSLGS